MAEFAEWFTEKMENNMYHRKGIMDNDECTWMQFKEVQEYEYMKFKDMSNSFHVFYAKKPITPEIIRTTFAMENDPILFVIDVLAMPSFGFEDAEFWLRALHAIYYGRIYFWNGNEIKALHYDWSNNNSMVSEPIETTGILFTRTDCQLRDFPGTFYIARFYDRAFWKEQSKPPPKKETWKERAKKQREEWEQATKGHAEEKPEDVFEAFKRAFKEEYERSQYRNQRANQNYSHQAPTGDKWLSVLIATGSLDAARTKYKQLAKQYHPDLNPGDSEALETMKAINIAYERVEEYWR